MTDPMILAAHAYLKSMAANDSWLTIITEELARLETENAYLRAHVTGLVAAGRTDLAAGQLWRDERPAYTVVSAPDPFERLSSADELTDIGLSYREVDAALQRQNAPDAFECLTGEISDGH